jgi:hypothetical protein
VTPNKPSVTVVAQRIRPRARKPVSRKVPVAGGHFTCHLKLRAGVYRVWAQTLADGSNIAGSSRPLQVVV